MWTKSIVLVLCRTATLSAVQAMKYFTKASMGNQTINMKALYNVAIKLLESEKTFEEGFEHLEKTALFGLKEVHAYFCCRH